MSQAADIDGDGYTIRLDDDLGAVVHEWDQYVSGEEFREACWELLDVVEQGNASKILVDQRAMNAMNDDDVVWLVETWTPKVTDIGLEYTVIVIQESVIAEMNTEKVLEAVGDVDGDQDVTTDIEEGRRLIREY